LLGATIEAMLCQRASECRDAGLIGSGGHAANLIS
jgi:hypothetical protein